MSVPLPSPSPLPASSTAKAIPRSRPQPISTLNAQHSPSLGHSPSRGSPSSPGRSGSLRTRPVARSATGLGSSVSGSHEDNWRDRSVAGPKSAVRTVGGFDKKPAAASGSANVGSPLNAGLEPPKDTKDKEGEKAAALSHVPCRFFRAGTCQAGDKCPFSHEEGGKREVCQWFLKGNCKFGHKCALAHVRPGEPMSMDKKNKKAAQLEARGMESGEGSGPGGATPRDGGLRKAEGRSALRPDTAIPAGDSAATPVPIRSALSSSLQSPPAHRIASSPLREPIGPPPSGPTGGSSPGFARSPIHPTAFASSPSRPSPLSSSFSARQSAGQPFSLKSTTTHSPLRPPTTAFSSSFSHSSLRDARQIGATAPPLSASFADVQRKNIWARNETPADQPEMLSPRRPIGQLPRRSQENVFERDEEDDDHGEDLLPSSLSDLLTPRERARRKSRRDSNESFSASPSRNAFLWGNGERLAQSAGPTMGPGFLQGLWSAEGADARKVASSTQQPPTAEFAFGPGTAQAHSRQSLLTQQRSPLASQAGPAREGDVTGPPFFIRALGDPSSPGTKALQEHAPGQSVPEGFASALSRIHLHGSRTGSGLAHKTQPYGATTASSDNRYGALAEDKAGQEHEEEGLFAMDG